MISSISSQRGHVARELTAMTGKDPSQDLQRNPYRAAFTLIELLIVVAIMGLLVSILIPALSSARRTAKATICLTRLRTAGQGLVLYANDNRDALVPARLPKVDDDHWRFQLSDKRFKYRPTFLAMMASQVGLAPFDEPLASKTLIDSTGQPGDRQNYSNEMYLCPEVDHWVDERNGAFGYNYQFLGNARLRKGTNTRSFKNWAVHLSRVKSPASCVAVADSMGTAASYPVTRRGAYEDNLIGRSKTGRTLAAMGNEGFNLDPPQVDPENGEMASLKASHQDRTALDPRHGRKGNVLWVDGHASGETLTTLGYEVDQKTGVVGFDGDNRYFHIHNKNEAWVDR